MSTLDRWARTPQSVWLRRALFQIHLWTGIAVGVYILVISLTGSLLVFRVDLAKRFDKKDPISTGTGPRLTTEQLKEAVARAYPGYTITRILESAKKPRLAVSVRLVRGSREMQRLFDPYTGEDQGDPLPPVMRAIAFTTDLHDNLLAGDAGRTVNGIGAVLLAALCLTGLVIWWPGVSRWRRSLIVTRRSSWRGFNWDLHSATGFWTLLLLVMWAASGIYLSFPDPFNSVVDYFSAPARRGVPRPGDVFLLWLARVHFGRFAGMPVKILWAALGLAPAVLFVTGAIMWWSRVLRPAMQRLPAPLLRPPVESSD